MARDYAKLSPRFWIGETGRKIRHNRSAQVLAAYLISAPGSTMIGIYYLPLPVVGHETGMDSDELEAAMEYLAAIDFAHYDPALELIWVPSMAAWQIDDRLKPGDKRVLGVRRELAALDGHPFVGEFWSRYGEAYCLGPAPEIRPFQPPSQGPSNPHRSQEHDQEQEHSLSGSSLSVPEAPDPETRAIPLPQAPYVPPRALPRVDRFAAATSGEFHRVLAVYPRKDDRVGAEAEFQVAAASHPGGEKGLADEILAAFPVLLKRHPYNGPNATRPFLGTVIKKKRWLDPESAPDDLPSAKSNSPPRGQPSTATREAGARLLARLEPGDQPT